MRPGRALALLLAAGAILSATAGPQRQSPDPAQQAGAGDERARPPGTSRSWDVSRAYRTAWSAGHMIGAPVAVAGWSPIGEVADVIVHAHGQVDRIVIEVLVPGQGSRRIGVPWRDVRIGPELTDVQVIPRGTTGARDGSVRDDPALRSGESPWRVAELIGRGVDLDGGARRGKVADVLFDQRGHAQAVVVELRAGSSGTPAFHAYPYSGYYPGPAPWLPVLDAPGVLEPFDYARLAEQSPYAGTRERHRTAGGRDAGRR